MFYSEFQYKSGEHCGLAWGATFGNVTNVEVRDSRTGYLLPARDGPGALPDVESCWDAAVAAAVAVPPLAPAAPTPARPAPPAPTRPDTQSISSGT